MSPQALNSLELYRGGDPSKIIQLLQIQDKSVVKELLDELEAKDIYELAVKLSIGAY